MHNHPVAALMRKSIVSSVVLAGLTSLSLLGHIESVSAATMTPCQVRHAECTYNCIGGTSGDGGSCIQRTCNHQFKMCAAVSGESKNPYHDYGPGLKPPKGVEGRIPTRPRSEAPPRSPRPSRPGRPPRGGSPSPIELTSQSPSGPAGQVRSPRGGLLDNLIGIRQQGPSATGSPMAPAAAPSAPPVIIR